MVLMIINIPHIKKDLFQMSEKQFLLLSIAEIIAESNKNIAPKKNIEGNINKPNRNIIAPIF